MKSLISRGGLLAALLVLSLGLSPRPGLAQSPPKLRETFERWNAGRLESFLVDITAKIVAAADPSDESGKRPLFSNASRLSVAARRSASLCQ